MINGREGLIEDVAQRRGLLLSGPIFETRFSSDGGACKIRSSWTEDVVTEVTNSVVFEYAYDRRHSSLAVWVEASPLRSRRT